MYAHYERETPLGKDTWLLLPTGMDTAPWDENARWPGQRQGVGEVTPVLPPVAMVTRRGQAACSTS